MNIEKESPQYILNNIKWSPNFRAILLNFTDSTRNGVLSVLMPLAHSLFTKSIRNEQIFFLQIPAFMNGM